MSAAQPSPRPARAPGLTRRTVLAARVGSVATLGGVALVAAGVLLGLVDGAAAPGGLMWALGVLALMAGLGASFAPRRIDVEPLVVASPVAGRWEAMNSPASKVPSHGTHAYGQTFAVDLVHVPPDAVRPAFGDGSHLRRPEEYPAFGQPLHAVADGEVVRAVDRWRDHRSRSSWPTLCYLLLEGMVRELGGPGPILGNHLVLRLGDGSHVVYAHLRRGSLRVHAGERVHAGQPLASCGNSGNSSEPHLHVQRMDGPRPLLAAGLPWAIQGGGPDGGTGLPGNGQTFEGSPAPA